MKSNQAAIYALYCPISGEVRYIGKAKDPLNRLKTHLRDSRTRNTPVYIWIRSLTEIGLKPEMKVLLITDDWEESEKRIIKEFKAAGNKLLNVASGGNEPYCSTEQRAINGRETARRIHANGENKRVWKLKQNMGLTLTFLLRHGRLEKYNETVRKLRLIAALCPGKFGQFSNLSNA